MTTLGTLNVSIVEQLTDQLGPCVLLKIPSGEKGPRTPDWQSSRRRT
jgi:hypothetical protein